MLQQIPARRGGIGHKPLQTSGPLWRDLAVKEFGDQIVDFFREALPVASHRSCPRKVVSRNREVSCESCAVILGFPGQQYNH
jgi:hypothetical protein